MVDSRKVAFTHGQFLFPQHLQQLTRYLESLSAGGITPGGGWGFLDLQLDRSQLNSGVLAVRQGSGIFHDGTRFQVPETARVAPTRTIGTEAEGELVFLCVARKEAALDGQEFEKSPSERSLVRYAVDTIHVPDNASELADPEAMDDQFEEEIDEYEQLEVGQSSGARALVGQLQTSLLLESDDRHEYHCVPIARVESVQANGEVTLDAGFIPTVLDVRASAALSEAITELRTVVDSRSRELADAVGDFTITGDISANVLWLMIANRYRPVLQEFGSTGEHPLVVFRYLLQMAGELATIALPEKRLVDIPDYQHANLQACFEPLVDLLRNMWGRPRHEAAIQLPLVYSDDVHAWLSSIRVRDFLYDRSFYLAVSSDISPSEIAGTLADNTTVGPVEDIYERVMQGKGLQLEKLDVRPRHLPELKNWVYFEVLKTENIWREIERSEAFAIHVDAAQEKFPGLRFRFWAVKD